MKIWFIRHAEAVDWETFPGSDHERPLTDRGIQRSKASFANLAKKVNAPDLVFSSEAIRAWETAQLFCDAFNVSDYVKTPVLNPGSSYKAIRKLVESVPDGTNMIVLIGHEPDFSSTVSQWTSGGTLNIKLKKGSLVELNVNGSGTATLTMSVPPKILAD